MTKDDLIRANLKQVCDYGKEIQGKTFTVPQDCPDTELGRKLFSIARNDMARAIIFELNWRKFQKFCGECHDTWTPEEEDRGIELLDFLIKIFESTPETWELFWQGKQPDDPKKMPFIGVGEEQLKYIDLTELKEVKIGMMGIKNV